MTGGNSLLDFGIFRDQARIGGLPINKPEQFLHSQCLVRVTAIHENFCFRLVCKHILNSKRRERVFDEARSLWLPIVTPLRSEIAGKSQSRSLTRPLWINSPPSPG